MKDEKNRAQSLAVVNDFSVEQQLFLYRATAELKQAYLNGGDCSRFRIGDGDLAVYLMFLENSTRTRESFRNAALFHGVKLNDFSASTSSFQKSESLVDTFKMLTGYNRRSLFIVRSREEGLCRALHRRMGEYAESIGCSRPLFINAGDGRHEHPTQEFLDQFSFIEQMENRRDRIHIALVGDLRHGRTVHSKADGLAIYGEVEVDLIAPEELKLPDEYLDRMKKRGYSVRAYESIDDYLAQGGVAPIWYFTRLQTERMGEDVREKIERLRKSVVCREDQIAALQKRMPECRFYHPLPRHKKYPVLPTFLDKTPFNNWDRQSVNGYFTRIALIAMLAGHFKDCPVSGEGSKEGADCGEREKTESAFIEEVAVPQAAPRRKTDYKVGIKPVGRGIVIDHIGRGESCEKIWNLIDRIRRNLALNGCSSHGVFLSSGDYGAKGIISLPDIDSFNGKQLKMLAALAPECTLNIIADNRVARKYRLHMPPRIYNFSEISCKNDWCVSHPDRHEPVGNEFIRTKSRKFACSYCEREYGYEEIWER